MNITVKWHVCTKVFTKKHNWLQQKTKSSIFLSRSDRRCRFFNPFERFISHARVIQEPVKIENTTICVNSSIPDGSYRQISNLCRKIFNIFKFPNLFLKLQAWADATKWNWSSWLIRLIPQYIYNFRFTHIYIIII